MFDNNYRGDMIWLAMMIDLNAFLCTSNNKSYNKSGKDSGYQELYFKEMRL